LHCQKAYSKKKKIANKVRQQKRRYGLKQDETVTTNVGGQKRLRCQSVVRLRRAEIPVISNNLSSIKEHFDKAERNSLM
jgi:hypothetical protein